MRTILEGANWWNTSDILIIERFSVWVKYIMMLLQYLQIYLILGKSYLIFVIISFLMDKYFYQYISIAAVTHETRYGIVIKKCRSPSGVTRKSTFNFPNLILFFVTFSFHPIKLRLLLNISLTVTYIPAAIYTIM